MDVHGCDEDHTCITAAGGGGLGVAAVTDYIAKLSTSSTPHFTRDILLVNSESATFSVR